MDIRYCYLIAADAGLAHDENGNKVETYIQVKIGGVKRRPDDDEAMNRDIRYGLADQLKINREWVVPISNEEYDAECSEDDDDYEE